MVRVLRSALALGRFALPPSLRLRSATEKLAPRSAHRLLRKIYYRIWRNPPPRLVPFDQLFGNVEKLHRSAPERVPTPEVPAMSLIEQASYLRGAFYTTPEDYTATLHNILYCPTNNVLLTPAKQVISETLNTGKLENLFIGELYTRRVRPLPGYAAVLRSRYNNYYHTLVDNLPRLLALHRPPYADLDEIKLLCPGGPTKTEAFFLERLCPENVRVVAPEQNSLYRVEHLIFTPFKTQRFAGYLPAGYAAFLHSRILPGRPSTRSRRLFISREKAKMRHIENQQALMAGLEERGFEKVIPEELPLQEQIELFYDAEVVVGAHGSGLANVLFSRGLKVFELFPAWYVVPHYYYLSKSLGHRYAYWCGNHGFRDVDTFKVDVPALLAELDRLMAA